MLKVAHWPLLTHQIVTLPMPGSVLFSRLVRQFLLFHFRVSCDSLSLIQFNPNWPFPAMADNRPPKRQKGEKLNQIDNISTYKKQPRSPAPKRRTDFSPFFSSSSSASSLSDSVSFIHGLSTVTMSTLDGSTGEEKELLPLSLVQCSKSTDKRSRLLTDFYEVPVLGVESVAQNPINVPCIDSNQKSDTATTSESAAEKSLVTESNGVCVTPGNVVWAKTGCKMWWPAEIIGETSSLADSGSQGTDGHVFVQFYGNHLSAWVDPARDVSQLEDCFEERSCNSMEDFQDALKQALKRKEDLSSQAQLVGNLNGYNHSHQQEQSSDKWTSSISSRTKCDFPKREKGKRERKPKIHFDEVSFPVKSSKKVRRFKIMRYLGLVAPIGSPF